MPRSSWSTSEQETERTRLVCQKLAELDLFTDMRFEASLPDGEKLDGKASWR